MRRTTAPRARRRLLAASTLAGLLVIGLATACNDDGDDDSVIDDPTSDTTPASTEPTAEPKTPREKAIEAAEQTIRDYTEVGDVALARPQQASDKDFRPVAVYGGLSDLHNELVYFQRERLRQIGETQIADMTARTVDLRYKPNQDPPLIPTVKLDICYDVSDVNVVDKTGHSVVESTRPDRVLREFWVYNYDWPNPASWKVGATRGELEPCAS